MTLARHEIARAKEHLEFQIRPYAESSDVWGRLVGSAPGATIYHRARWLELLRQAYGFELSIAGVCSADEIRAGCLLAQSRRPFSHRMVSLPFSDFCPPLSTDAETLGFLLNSMTSGPAVRRSYEIRGIAAPPPWQAVFCFERWVMDLDRSLAVIERSAAANFRRQLRRGREAGVCVSRGHALSDIHRFYQLQLESRRRLGLPPQPLRFFECARRIFSAAEGIEVWIASHAGRDLAGLVLLREGDELYYKWGARREAGPPGANHLLFWSAIEHFAGKVSALDLGRTDARNEGGRRFKKELGGQPAPLPYSFFPVALQNISAEHLTGPRKLLAHLWRFLPIAVTRAIGNALYGYLS